MNPEEYFSTMVAISKDEFLFLCQSWNSRKETSDKLKIASFMDEINELVELGTISPLSIYIFIDYHSEHVPNFPTKELLEYINKGSKSSSTKPVSSPKTSSSSSCGGSSGMISRC